MNGAKTKIEVNDAVDKDNRELMQNDPASSSQVGCYSSNSQHPSHIHVTASTSETVCLSDSQRSDVHPRLYRRRWLIVFLFASYSTTNAYQWIHLNIIGDKILSYYNASLPASRYNQDIALDWLSMLYMLAYIPLIFPTMWLLDKKGLRVVALIGTFLNALGAWLKCASVNPDRFALVLFAQAICAVAQVFILGIPARLAAVWFGPNEVSTATAIGVFGNQFGCALGFLIPPEIVTNTGDLDVIGYKLSIMFYGGAAITSLLFILVLLFFRNSPPIPPSQAQMLALNDSSPDDYFGSLRHLFSNTSFILLLITYGINTGSYYSIGTLLNPIVLHYFEDDHLNAGRIGLTLVLSGVLGSILSGIWLDRTKSYKLTTVVIYILSCAGMVAFTLTLCLKQIWIVFLCSGLLGFFMTGYLPVGFEFAAELTYPESEGTSSGLLNASAQIFGIILTLGIRAMTINLSNGMLAGNLSISSILLLGVVGTILIRSNLRRQNAQQRHLKESPIEEDNVVVVNNGRLKENAINVVEEENLNTI